MHPALCLGTSVLRQKINFQAGGHYGQTVHDLVGHLVNFMACILLFHPLSHSCMVVYLEKLLTIDWPTGPNTLGSLGFAQKMAVIFNSAQNLVSSLCLAKPEAKPGVSQFTCTECLQFRIYGFRLQQWQR